MTTTALSRVSCFVICVSGFLLPACGKSSSSSSSTTDPLQKAAEAAVLAEVQKHFTRSTDGYLTAITPGQFAPEFIRQIKDLQVDNSSNNDLSDADKQNGIQFAGEVFFKKTTARECGDPGVLLDGVNLQTIMKPKNQWSQWSDFEPPSVKILKVHDKWQINPDTMLLRGHPPTQQELTRFNAR